jgi:hypothetical protein
MKNSLLIIAILAIFSCTKPTTTTPTVVTPVVTHSTDSIKIVASWREDNSGKMYTFGVPAYLIYYINNVKTGDYTFDQHTLMLHTNGFGGSSTYYNISVTDSFHFTATSDLSTLIFSRM